MTGMEYILNEGEQLQSELAALKAENEELKHYFNLDLHEINKQLSLENEQLKQSVDNWHNQAKFGSEIIKQLQADKAELLDALKQFETSVKGYSIEFEKHYRSLLSKHEAK
jgi:regulator of replication initiation timing